MTDSHDSDARNAGRSPFGVGDPRLPPVRKPVSRAISRNPRATIASVIAAGSGLALAADPIISLLKTLRGLQDEATWVQASTGALVLVVVVGIIAAVYYARQGPYREGES